MSLSVTDHVPKKKGKKATKLHYAKYKERADEIQAMRNPLVAIAARSLNHQTRHYFTTLDLEELGASGNEGFSKRLLR